MKRVWLGVESLVIAYACGGWFELFWALSVDKKIAQATLWHVPILAKAHDCLSKIAWGLSRRRRFLTVGPLNIVEQPQLACTASAVVSYKRQDLAVCKDPSDPLLVS